MNIWILNHHARNTGRHPSLSEQLSSFGAEVTLFSAGFIHNEFVETKEYKNNLFTIESINHKFKRIYIKTMKYNRNGYKRLLNQLHFALNAYRVGLLEYKNGNKPDIIVGSSVHLFTGLTSYFLAKKLNVKFVFEIRDLWPQTLVDLGALKENSFITKSFYKLERFLYKKADLIISVLPAADEYIKKLGIDVNKIIHIPNGIDIEYMEKSLNDNNLKKKIYKEYETYKNKFVITFTGSHGVANGLETIVEAAKIIQEQKLMANVHFLLVGEGPEKEKLIHLTEKYALQNISFKKSVSKNEVPHILQLSDVCLFHLIDTPVFKYGISSNKLFDYMYSGKPIIFSVNASNDFSKTAKCGFTTAPEKPQEIVNTIQKLLQLPSNELLDMGNNGKTYVEKNHSFKNLAFKMLESFKKII